MSDHAKPMAILGSQVDAHTQETYLEAHELTHLETHSHKSMHAHTLSLTHTSILVRTLMA